MTVQIAPVATSISYTVAATATDTFTVPFPFDDDADLAVLVDGEAVDFVVSEGTVDTGIVTAASVVLAAAVTNATVLIYRDMPLSQDAIFALSGSFRTATLNREVSRIWMALQDALLRQISALADSLEREEAIVADALARHRDAVTRPTAERSDTPLTLEPKATRANRALLFDAVGGLVSGEPADGVIGFIPSAFGNGLMLAESASAAREHLEMLGTTHTVSAQPTYDPADESSILTVFEGDWSNPAFAVGHWITGADTLGQPTTGYRYQANATADYVYMYNESGWNQDLGGNGGRTGATARRTVVFQAGQGDLACYNGSAFVTGTKAGSTSFLANPAASLFNGDMQAGADGVYLNVGEMYLTDGGYDVAGCGWVVNMNRTNAAGAKDVFWAGYRSQSVGTQPVSAHYSAIGKAKHGLEFTGSDFGAGLAAIAIKALDRIYLNASNASPILNPEDVGLPLTWIDYEPTLSTIRIVVDNVPALLVASGQATLGVLLKPLSGTIAALGTPSGTGLFAFATNARKPAEGVGAGTGLPVFWDGAAWLTFDGIAATV